MRGELKSLDLRCVDALDLAILGDRLMTVSVKLSSVILGELIPLALMRVNDSCITFVVALSSFLLSHC